MLARKFYKMAHGFDLGAIQNTTISKMLWRNNPAHFVDEFKIPLWLLCTACYYTSKTTNDRSYEPPSKLQITRNDQSQIDMWKK